MAAFGMGQVMKQYDIWGISFSQLRAFIVTADYESITKAASAMMMTQSALSKNIKALESELGLVLFARDKGKLKLSPAGKVFRDEAAGICATLERAVERAHAAQAVVPRRVIIAVPDSMSYGETIGRAIESYAERHEGFSFGVEYCNFRDIPKLIETKRVDLAITPLFDERLYDSDGFSSAVLERFPLRAFMQPANPLSEKEFLTCEDLGGKPLIAISEANSPLYEQNVITPIGIMGGFRPRVEYLASNPRSVAASATSSQDIFIADKYYEAQGFVSVEIVDTKSGILLVWHSDADALVRDLAAHVVESW